MTLKKLELNIDPPVAPALMRTADALLAGKISNHIRFDSRTFDVKAVYRIKGIRTITAEQVNQNAFDALCKMRSIENLYINAGTFSDLANLRNLKKLRFLSIFGNSRLRSLDGIQNLGALTGLKIMDVNNLHSLDAVSRLKDLQALYIQSGVWKSMAVRSLKPLAKLSSLKMFVLGGVDIKDKSFSPVLKLKGLKRFHCGSDLTMEEYASLAARFRHIEFTPSRPFYELQSNLYIVQGPDKFTPVNVFVCGKCGQSTQVQIIGRRGPVLCTKCDSGRLQKYVDRYDKVYKTTKIS